MAAANFITLHAIHAVPASLLNRDDANSAKRITFGGTERVRVSSQAWKRAIRVSMRGTAIDNGAFGTRTNRFPQIVTDILTSEYNRDADAASAKTIAVFKAMTPKGLSVTDKGTTSAAIFAGPTFPTTVAKLIDEHFDAIGDTVPGEIGPAAVAALDTANAIDLALFGRMLAEIPVGGRIDGAVGVAHAFSVDPAAVEPDFFTAVDDAAPEGESVSGNLGVTQIAAPVLYRTAYLDRRQLRRNFASVANVDELAVAAEAAFIDWFIRAVPSAKQRSTVAATLPSLVAATCGPQVLSAADAYAAAIYSEDVVSVATTRLVDALGRHTAIVPGLRIERLAIGIGLPSTVADGAHTSSSDFIDAVQSA